MTRRPRSPRNSPTCRAGGCTGSARRECGRSAAASRTPAATSSRSCSRRGSVAGLRRRAARSSGGRPRSACARGARRWRRGIRCSRKSLRSRFRERTCGTSWPCPFRTTPPPPLGGTQHRTRCLRMFLSRLGSRPASLGSSADRSAGGECRLGTPRTNWSQDSRTDVSLATWPVLWTGPAPGIARPPQDSKGRRPCCRARIRQCPAAARRCRRIGSKRLRSGASVARRRVAPPGAARSTASPGSLPRGRARSAPIPAIPAGCAPIRPSSRWKHAGSVAGAPRRPSR